MNIQKFLIPASIAATFHVALFWLAPEEGYIRIVEVPLGKSIKTSDWVPQPREDPEDPPIVSAEVKPLVGAPAPVGLDEPPVRAEVTAFPMPIANIRPEVRVDSKSIPSVIGDPDGDVNGDFTATLPVISAGLLDQAPRAKAQIPPEYPYAMKQNGTSGTVLVEFDVDTTGRVTRAEARNFTAREFVEPALRAVRKWRFEPGRRDAKRVAFRMVVPIEFGIEPGN